MSKQEGAALAVTAAAINNSSRCTQPKIKSNIEKNPRHEAGRGGRRARLSICGSIGVRIGVNRRGWGVGRRGFDISRGGGGAVTQLKKCREIPEIMSKQITDRAATSRAELSGAASTPAAATLALRWLLFFSPRFQSLESPCLVTGGKLMSLICLVRSVG